MKINVDRINLSNNKIKIGVISDIHHIKKCQADFYQPILKQMQKLKVQYILIPGDIVDDPQIVYTKEINYLINFCKSLALMAPVLISKGNHEIRKEKYPIEHLYNILNNIPNIYVLDNQSIELNNIQFIGFSPSNQSYLRKYKDKWQPNFITEFNNCHFKIKHNKITILLCHSPEVITNENVYSKLHDFNNINYIVCGHMHNGLAFKKIEKYLKNRGLCGPNYVIFPKYCRGIFPLGNSKLVVCNSVRTLTKDMLIFRLLDKMYATNVSVLEI